MGEKEKLTQPPENLKEAVDWLALAGGGWGGSGCGLGKHQELEKALKQLEGFDHTFTSNFSSLSLSGLIYALANNFGYEFLGHMSQGGGFNFNGKGIIQQGNNYTSKYQDAAWNGSDDAKDMARIFLCASAMAFFGLSYLYWRCKRTQGGGWGAEHLTGSGTDPLGFFITTMGYQSNYLDSGKKGGNIVSLLEENGKGFDGLVQPATQIIYDNYVRKLKDTYKPASDTLGSPLTGCYNFAKYYCKYKFKNAGDINGTLTAIKETLEKFSTLCYSYSYLKDDINISYRLICQTPHPPRPERRFPPPSPPAPSPAHSQ
ncbi:uncharacterized protein BcabD6B2_18950 [Babesia caballi]|uniref:Uncharacterized protein n=1 Tax=Babesia caballi TaxID=5871 RepID=A0AAV4LSB8_BABCB|nr:hypothetical protein, conserved [Babesia caballi]